MFLDAIGDCDECGSDAFFEYMDTTYCVRHSSAINSVDPDKVDRIADNLEDIDGVATVEPWSMAFIVVVPAGDEIPWTVHDVADEHGYRVSNGEPEQGSIVEPKDTTFPYRDMEEYLSR
ncbi:hypothetical protein NP511_18035 [Natrinema thermotolerans]|uniref:Uncharacterized protein n=1 Tax=Natrinema thermotolerans TaxID=121872 RepID=A0AAF0SYM7_9EURY|nr:hypothetical protein [Natrinema thermotolerans]QCC60256.1 hypothetical protein DVR14_17100 [Natrinema thermotolerans]QCC61167.1 hypothetical protein DVR14_21230 [Natrinema thermotolerans]WMT07276.1 hypothetical protein NP511_18035 [Natrinema thermotolerans]